MKGLTIVLLTVSALIGLLFAFGFATSLLWNYALVPQGLKEIDTLTGVALNTLGTIMLGGTAVRLKGRKT